jgi:hypothetical protein
MIGVARRFAAIGGWGAGFALLWINFCEPRTSSNVLPLRRSQAKCQHHRGDALEKAAHNF